MDLPLRCGYITSTGLAYGKNSPLLPIAPYVALTIAGSRAKEKFYKSTEREDPDPFTAGTRSGSTIPSEKRGSQCMRGKDTRLRVLGLQILRLVVTKPNSGTNVYVAISMQWSKVSFLKRSSLSQRFPLLKVPVCHV